MTANELLPFFAVVGVITVSPGPDTALVVRNTLKGDVRDGLLTAAGCSIGLLVWGIAAALGIATIVSASSTLFVAVRIAGGMYLAWLGMRMLYGEREPAQAATRSASASRVSGNSHRPLVEGLLTDLLNPKAAAFSTALLPQFVTTATGDIFTTTLLLATIASGAAFAGLLGYASIASRARVALKRPRIRLLFDRITGVVLVGLGIRMLAEPMR